MAGSALAIDNSVELEHSHRVHPEEYGRSLVAIKEAGRIAVEQLIGNSELFPDYATAVAEMLKTDKEFKKKLDIDNRRTHDVVDEQVRNARGEAMVDVLSRGAAASARLAKHNPAYQAQADRDLPDVRLAERNDKLKVGQTMWGVSMAPRKAIAEHPKVYKGRFGYDEELIYVQSYSRVDEETLITGSYSIDCGDVEKLRELLASKGMSIPEGVSDSEWLDFSQAVTMTAEEADAFIRDLRQEYYLLTGQREKRQSITEYIERHKDILEGIFSAYYPELARASFTGENNETLRSLAKAILATPIAKLKPEIRRQLIKISNSRYFDDEATKTMDSIIRYAAVEELRKYLVPTKGKTHTLDQPQFRQDPDFIQDMVARNLQAGIAAERSYGGCPGNVELGEGDIFDEVNAKQEAYGGANEESYSFDKETYCVVCQDPPKAGEKKKMCGPCNICKDCDKELKKKAA